MWWSWQRERVEKSRWICHRQVILYVRQLDVGRLTGFWMAFKSRRHLRGRRIVKKYESTMVNRRVAGKALEEQVYKCPKELDGGFQTDTASVV
jgi:hypothetical protein